MPEAAASPAPHTDETARLSADTALLARKIFAGPRLKRLRREQGLTQSAMAAALGFSASYLNLVERNQRPVSVQLLLRLTEVFDVNIQDFAGGDDRRALAHLNEILSDPVFSGLSVEQAELRDMVDSAPTLVEALSRLHEALTDTRAQASALSSNLAGDDDTRDMAASPLAEVRDYIQAERNHWPELDRRAEALATELGLASPNISSLELLAARLEARHHIQVRIMPEAVMADRLRHFDRHSRRLQLSELLDARGRQFQVAQQLARSEFRELIDSALTAHPFKSDEAQRLARITLSNYVAGALLMPYEPFLADARALGYDIDHLARRYGTSFEQVCHRLTTLQRPGAKGVPFFFLRVDKAGNVSKRFSAGSFHFSKYGGTCPLWNVHDSFAVPGRIITQLIQMPDDTTYFSLARTVDRPGAGYGRPDPQLAVALGCDIAHAGELVYARALNLNTPQPVPVGPTCRLCERPACPARAVPPMSYALRIDERERGLGGIEFDKLATG